jgi:hypothetical protein
LKTKAGLGFGEGQVERMTSEVVENTGESSFGEAQAPP